jgi:hypothetical protein
LVDLRFQLLREILELRSQARLKPLTGPHKLATFFPPTEPRRRQTISRSDSTRAGKTRRLSPQPGRSFPSPEFRSGNRA